ncbi:MAG: nicotinate-nucleotide adenylyltransferase [Desulfarculales bacterium]|jgi:nicotinate-nucleotide adenylyltransferase|nr:nicotinate-nucleotide adenylyltransferase [Desulfarculales bacterium]
MKPFLAIFGGTFDPIHLGHLRAAQEAAELLRLSKVLFMPSSQPPHSKAVEASAGQRLDMVRLATEDNPLFDISDIEIKRAGSSYAVETLRQMKKLFPGHQLLFMLGADAFFLIHTWYHAQDLFELADFAVMDRPGTPRYNILTYLQDHVSSCFTAYGERGAQLPNYSRVSYLTTTLLDISSSEIKRKTRLNNSIHYLVPPAVMEYIEKHHLYK